MNKKQLKKETVATLKIEPKLLLAKTKMGANMQESIPMAETTMKYSAKQLPTYNYLTTVTLTYRIMGEKNQTLLEQIREYLV